jgi:hypothetical protein
MRVWSVAVVAALFCFPSSALAQDAGKDEMRELLLKMQQQLDEQQKKIETLETALQIRQAAPAQEAEQPLSAPPPESATVIEGARAPSPKPAATVSTTPEFAHSGSWWRSDRLTLGGYGSARFESNDVPGLRNGFTFRRFVLTTDAHITDRIRVYSETELERLLELELEKSATREDGGVRFESEVEGNNGAEIGLEQMWAQFDLGKKQGIRGGIILVPLGRFNILHDDDYWDLPRRTLVDRDAAVVPVPVAWREMGLGWVGSIDVGSTGRLEYQAYVMNGAALNANLEVIAQTRDPRRNRLAVESSLGLASGAVNGDSSAKAFGWRLAYSPTLAGEVAVSGYHGRYTPDWISARESVNSLGVDWKWRYRGFEVEGEFVHSDFGNVPRVAQSLAAAIGSSSAETSFAEAAELESEIEAELGGLADRKFGFWTDVKYHWHPGWLKRSFLGRGFEDPQLIPIVRYERVWLPNMITELAFAAGVITEFATESLSQDRVTVGLNYKPTPQFGWQFAYEHNRRLEGGSLIFPSTDQESTNGFLMGWTFSF